MEQARDTFARAILTMRSMKLFSLLAVTGISAIYGAELAAVHTVYMMPMAHGFEQYLANTLTNEHVFVIVTDPKMADAVLTDHIGEALQERLDVMLTVPPPEKPDPKDGEKSGTEEPKAGHTSSLADPQNKLTSPGASSTVGHGKGTVFLVDAKSRQVLWSTYELPKDATARESDRIASAIVSRLKKDMGTGKK